MITSYSLARNYIHVYCTHDFQPGTIAYATGWGATIPDDKLGPLAFLIPKEQKRPKVLQVSCGVITILSTTVYT
jgi:hypothetical protein